MKTFSTLIKREYWENHASFFKVPAIFAAILSFVGIVYLILFGTGVVHYSINGHINLLDNIPSDLTPQLFYGLSVPFSIILYLIVFYYFLGALYDDRKDRSILFWRSLPISEWQSTCAKSFAGIFIAPLCTWICIIALELLLLIYITVAATILHLSPISALWSPSMILGTWVHILGMLYLQALWLFPLFGWCLLCSAYAKKLPFLCAIIPIVVLVIIEAIFTHHSYIARYVGSRFFNALGTINHHYLPLKMYSLYWSLPVGAALMAAATYLRYICFRADDQ